MITHPFGVRVVVATAAVACICLSLTVLRHSEKARAVEPATLNIVQCATKTPCAEFRNTSKGAAIVARSIKGDALDALSRQGTAVVGTTLGAPLNQFYSTVGVLGRDESSGALPNYGVFGDTSAAGDTGVAGAFSAYGSPGIFGVGVLGFDQSGPQENRNVIGVLGESEGTGVFGLSMATPAPPGQQQSPGVNAACAGGGVALLASNGFVSPSGDLMSVDCAGNMILKGSLMSNGVPLIRTHSSVGPDVAAYPLVQADRNIEDVGQAQLVDGGAEVRFDPRFAASVDWSRAYMVFITADGPSRGLYVSSKTQAGFSVRENPGGRSTIAFDYRIIAKPLGDATPRLPTVGQVETTFYRQTLTAPHSTQSAARWVALMRNPHAVPIEH